MRRNRIASPVSSAKELADVSNDYMDAIRNMRFFMEDDAVKGLADEGDEGFGKELDEVGKSLKQAYDALDELKFKIFSIYR